MEVKIEPSWKETLKDEFAQDYFRTLSDFVKKEYQAGVVYPAPKNIFRAFDECPFERVKVVVLGQDPYHGKGQAIGLSFAVEKGVALPPSLQNMYKELSAEYATPLAAVYERGPIRSWPGQGVLLLNATLTVRAGAAGSHQDKGWEQFTDAVIRALSREREHLVFLLWGNYARAKGAHIDRERHLVLEAPHPSPFSAASGFFGCGHFTKANAYLEAHGDTSIDWVGETL
jgi:uracil-DNA glycosylase